MSLIDSRAKFQAEICDIHDPALPSILTSQCFQLFAISVISVPSNQDTPDKKIYSLRWASAACMRLNRQAG